MCVLPLFHINALLYSLCGAIACGGAVIPVRRFSAGTFWSTVVATGATEVNLVPAAANILIRRPRAEFVRGHPLTKVFVAPCTEEMVRALVEEFGIRDVIECYGMTEIPGVFAVPFEGPRKVGSMGVASPHPDPAVERPQARIVDAAGADVPCGAMGELLVRTPTMLKGYFRAPEATAAAIEQGWFRTGDLALQDADGFFYYKGRMKDLIRRRGENISGLELDKVLGAHPSVADAAAIGVPSELGEEDIFAVVVPRQGSVIDPWELKAWVADRLSAGKAPRYVCVVDSLPYTPTQRVEKYKLRADKALLQRATDTEGEQP
jgi:crotonobetaine/carnitine-CoA ligase